MHAQFQHRRYLIPFRARLLPQIFCDTLVIGSGVAGLRAALAAAEHGEVILVTKSDIDRSATTWAQGGVAAVLETTDTGDAIESHIGDTLAAGCGLCTRSVVEQVVQSARTRIEELLAWGMQFDLDESGRPARTREGGHRNHRVLHAGGDATGKEVVRCLSSRVCGTPAIRVFDHCFALDLLTTSDAGNGSVVGAITHHPKYGLQVIWAYATIIATGGCGQAYRETTNPPVCTGDGVAMAYRAGAALADMAFVQFHPTTLYVAGSERALISEAVRGEGAYLVDRMGDRFMVGRHEMAELAPRDVVSRSIIEHLVETGETNVFLDARHFKPGFFSRRFPGIHQKLAQFDIDPEHDLVPVNPGAHYTIGGIWVDACGRSTVPGLYTCGESSYSGLHGGNRLASNSLLEGLVYGELAGRTSAECRPAHNGNGNGAGRSGWLESSKPIISDIPISNRGELDLNDVRSSLRSAMWRHLGIVRNGPLMDDLREMIEFWRRYTMDKIFDDPMGWEVQNMLSVCSLMCASARWRRESRGTHTRTDEPISRPDFRVHDLWSRLQVSDKPLMVPCEDTEPDGPDRAELAANRAGTLRIDGHEG